MHNTDHKMKNIHLDMYLRNILNVQFDCWGKHHTLQTLDFYNEMLKRSGMINFFECIGLKSNLKQPEVLYLDKNLNIK